MKHDAVYLSRWCEQFAAPYRHPGCGAIVAIATREDLHVERFGVVDAARREPPAPDTLFEIGSITKVFTAVLLARLSLDGRVDPDASINTQVPGFDALPGWITPRALATHTAGVPRIPVPWWRRPFLSPIDPYAGFGARDLMRWAKRHGRRARYPPRRWRPRYSNLGPGLLGFALGCAAGTDYGTALRVEVLKPLGLHDTTLHPDDAQARRFATPHRSAGAPTSAWHFGALAGAGGLRASVLDLVAFARAVIDAPADRGPLAAAIRMTLDVQVPARDARAPAQCLGWSLLPCPRLPLSVHAHDGSTLGSSSALYVLPKRDLAVVVLANRGLGLAGPFAIARSDPLGVIEAIVATADVRRAQ